MQNAPSRNRTSTQQFGFQPISHHHHSQISQSNRNISVEQSSLHLGSHMGSATTPTNGAQHGDGAPSLSSTEGGSSAPKKSLPANGKKTKGRVKIKMEFIDNKLRRYTTFSKRKTGIMKKAYELSTLTGTQVMLLVASETGHVYTFATRKLQPMITSEAGKALIQTCLNSPDPPPGPGGSSGLDQRMSATGFEEPDLTYSVGDDCEKIPDGLGEKGLVYSAEPSPPSGDTSPSHHPPHLSMGGHSSPPSSPAAASSSSESCSPSHQMVSNMTSTALLQQQSGPSSQLSNSTNNSAGFATILAAAPTGGSLSPAVQIGTFHSTPSSENVSPGGQATQVYRIPTQGAAAQAFSLAISGPSKTSSNNSSTSSQNQALQNSSHQNLSLVSGNVMIPATQTILQAGLQNGGAFMYHTGQGLVYATPTTLPEGGVILNIGQEQGGGSQQFITIPVSLSLTPAQQQQLMHVSPTAIATTCQVTGCSPAKSHKSRK